MPVASRTPERIGSYRLIKQLGRGKVGQVWEVERGTDNSRWAMKVIFAGPDLNRANIANLKHEYAVGRDLSHENVIKTRDLVEDPCASFLILELFRSANLKQWILDQQPKALQLAEPIIRQAAAGLGYLHERGWIHRDVKPDNFLVDPLGHVKLIDFNIAQRRRGRLGRLLGLGGKLQGTQSYMSPEQIRSKPVDERADVYSLGCVIYEIITGKPPFSGTTSDQLLSKHLRQRPPALSADEYGLSPEFIGLVQSMLSKDASRRPESMKELLALLDKTGVFRRTPGS